MGTGIPAWLDATGSIFGMNRMRGAAPGLVRRFALLWALGMVLCGPAATAGASVELGSEVLAAGGFRELQGRRVGLLTNPSGVNRRRESTIEVLRRAPGVRLAALFGPEHGIRGTVRAGDAVGEATDPRTGLRVFSLYGSARKPTPEMLRGLDVLVYDLQDTGVRSYTYISTMGLAMEACAEQGVEFVVLDRPNPLGGLRVEGPLVQPPFRSFVSQWPVPYVYGLTCGELARMINGERWISRPCRLTVVPLRGWHRGMSWADTGLHWTPTSPNVPTADAVFGLAALGLLGEISGNSGFSIGGVYGRPFQCVGAPWIDVDRLSRHLESLELPGLRFPVIQMESGGKRRSAVALQFTDRSRAPLLSLSFHMLDAVRAVSGRRLLAEAEGAGRNLAMFDKVIGSDTVRQRLRGGETASGLVRSWQAGETAFRAARRPYLLYPEAAPVPRPVVREKSPVPDARPFLVITVVRGDTVTKIARDFGVSLSDIVEANPGLDAKRLKVGQTLRIPR